MDIKVKTLYRGRKKVIMTFVSDPHLNPKSPDTFPFQTKVLSTLDPFSVLPWKAGLSSSEDGFEVISILVIGGDLMMMGAVEELEHCLKLFSEHLNSGHFDYIVVIAGNHDICLQPFDERPESYRKQIDNANTGKGNYSFDVAKQMFEELQDQTRTADKSQRFYYLDGREVVTVAGVDFFGSPYSLIWHGAPETAFQKNDNDVDFWVQHLAPIFRRKNPKNPFVLIVHGPVYGVNDCGVQASHNGSRSIRLLIECLGDQAPDIVCFGHIHEAYGVTRMSAGKELKKKIVFVNCASRTSTYKLDNLPFMYAIDLEEPTEPVVEPEAPASSPPLLESIVNLFRSSFSFGSYSEELNNFVNRAHEEFRDALVRMFQAQPPLSPTPVVQPFHTRFSFKSDASGKNFSIFVVDKNHNQFPVSPDFFYQSMRQHKLDVRILSRPDSVLSSEKFSYCINTSGSDGEVVMCLDPRFPVWQLAFPDNEASTPSQETDAPYSKFFDRTPTAIFSEPDEVEIQAN